MILQIDNNMIWIISTACILTAALVIFHNYRRTKKTMDTIEQMLARAGDVRFLEKTFDESRMSALETKFAHFLTASAVSAKNVATEKEKIETLIADISHQTKTPIANLLLYSELLQEADLQDDVRGNAEAIYAQTEKLHFLIDSLVKLSRLENGIITLSPKPTPLLPMLRSIHDQLAPKAADKGLYLQLHDTESTAEISAVCDAKWTAEAVCNLIDNAIKYTAQGGVTISITAYELFARIDIADTGIGIAEEEHAKIFSRFYRSQDAQDQEGVGIGLYLAREIVNGEGGYIKVSSSIGNGAVFSVFLPK